MGIKQISYEALSSRDFWHEFGQGIQTPFRFPSRLSHAYDLFSDFLSDADQIEKHPYETAGRAGENTRKFNRFHGHASGSMAAMGLICAGLLFARDTEIGKYAAQAMLGFNAADLIYTAYKRMF